MILWLSIFVPKHKKASLDRGISSYTLTVVFSSNSTNLTHLLYLKMLYLPFNYTRLSLLGLALVSSVSLKNPSSSLLAHLPIVIKEEGNLFWSLSDSSVNLNPLVHWLTAWFSFSMVTHFKFSSIKFSSTAVDQSWNPIAKALLSPYLLLSQRSWGLLRMGKAKMHVSYLW